MNTEKKDWLDGGWSRVVCMLAIYGGSAAMSIMIMLWLISILFQN